MKFDKVVAKNTLTKAGLFSTPFKSDGIETSKKPWQTNNNSIINENHEKPLVWTGVREMQHPMPSWLHRLLVPPKAVWPWHASEREWCQVIWKGFWKPTSFKSRWTFSTILLSSCLPIYKLFSWDFDWRFMWPGIDKLLSQVGCISLQKALAGTWYHEGTTWMFEASKWFFPKLVDILVLTANHCQKTLRTQHFGFQTCKASLVSAEFSRILCCISQLPSVSLASLLCFLNQLIQVVRLLIQLSSGLAEKNHNMGH